MKKYKVEFIETRAYVIDTLAESEDEAIDKATHKFSEIKQSRTEHYYQVGDTDWSSNNVYDVTNTDDPFNP